MSVETQASPVPLLPAAIRHLPKVELHMHLGGSYPLSFIKGLASSSQFLHLLQEMRALSSGVNYSEGFSIFGLVERIVNTDERVRLGTQALCQELCDDGVIYAEIRTGLKDFGGGLRGYLEAVLGGIEDCSHHNPLVKLILSIRRNSSPQVVSETVDLALEYRERGVVGMDLSGPEDCGDSAWLIPELKRAKAGGLGLAVHIGETPKEENHLAYLQAMDVDRVGHAVHISPETEAWILKRGIPIEACLSSNALVRAVACIGDHPVKRWWKGNFPLAICTDDPLLFGANLSAELQMFSNLCSANLEDLLQVCKNSLSYSFLPKTERLTLERRYFS